MPAVTIDFYNRRPTEADKYAKQETFLDYKQIVVHDWNVHID